MIRQALDEPLRQPASEDLGNESGQPVESTCRLTGDYRAVNDLETSQVGSKGPGHATIDEVAQAVRHCAHVSLLPQFHGDLLGANLTQIQASDNLVLWEVKYDPNPGTVAHVSATARRRDHQRTLARDLQVI